MRGSGGAAVLAALMSMSAASAHLTVTMQAGEGVDATGGKTAGGGFLAMGGYGSYAEFRASHADPKTYTYKIEIMTPKVGASLKSVKPGHIAGWTLAYNDIEPDDAEHAARSKMTYTAEPGNELFDAHSVQVREALQGQARGLCWASACLDPRSCLVCERRFPSESRWIAFPSAIPSSSPVPRQT